VEFIETKTKPKIVDFGKERLLKRIVAELRRMSKATLGVVVEDMEYLAAQSQRGGGA